MKIVKQDKKIIVFYDDGRYAEYDVDLVKKEIAQLKEQIKEIDILDDDEKLLAWAKSAYRQSELYKSLDDLRKQIDFLQSLLKG